MIPNLLTWRGSAIVNDLKLENFEKTSGARDAMGQQIVLFAPLDTEGRTHAYNPLDFVSSDRNLRVNEVQAITAKLVVTPPRADPMWTNEARVLLDGLILFMLDVNQKASLGAVYRAILSTQNFGDYLTWAMKEYETSLDPMAVMQFNGFLGKAFKEQSGVLSYLKAALSLFANPLIDGATSSTDFDPRDLRRRPMTIYLGVMPRDIARLGLVTADHPLPPWLHLPREHVDVLVMYTVNPGTPNAASIGEVASGFARRVEQSGRGLTVRAQIADGQMTPTADLVFKMSAEPQPGVLTIQVELLSGENKVLANKSTRGYQSWRRILFACTRPGADGSGYLRDISQIRASFRDRKASLTAVQPCPNSLRLNGYQK